LLGLGFRV
jgi:hypothetical protein